MILLLCWALGLIVGIGAGALYTRWQLFALPFKRKEPPPQISVEAICPACGNSGCDLNYDAQQKRVARKCKTCGCIVTQPPIAPDLFTNV
jgi:hypothetical protein